MPVLIFYMIAVWFAESWITTYFILGDNTPFNFPNFCALLFIICIWAIPNLFAIEKFHKSA